LAGVESRDDDADGDHADARAAIGLAISKSKGL
jgi:hypothetical protein